MAKNNRISAISNMPVASNLRIRETHELVSLYRPLLVRCARSIELIPHLKEVINDGK